MASEKGRSESEPAKTRGKRVQETRHEAGSPVAQGNVLFFSPGDIFYIQEANISC